jgi:uncharacterized protein (DUF608 family)
LSEAKLQCLRSIPLGTLGTGAVEVCSDGRFRNLTINNNRTESNRIPVAPHTFLAVCARGRDVSYCRRLQIADPGLPSGHALPQDGLRFRAHYPLVDCGVHDPGSPVEVVWSAFAPVVPYDYDASALPLIYLGIQVTNTSDEAQEIAALLNWQNTCGHSASTFPEHPANIVRDTLITQADWERMRGGGVGDNERRLSSKTGQMEANQAMEVRPGDVPPNALVFGDVRSVDSNEDGQYCVATPWNASVRTAVRVWDPENPTEEAAFWNEFALPGGHSGDESPGHGVPRCGAVCNHFRVEAGQTRSVEFVVSWYCPRYVVNGVAEGNFYANNHPDARAVARIGLTNSKYYFAAISGWQQRLASADLPAAFVKRLLASCEVLSTNSLHTRNGGFGLFESARDTRVNYLRDRWFWSMGLLLFYPRLELDTLDRVIQRVIGETDRSFRISEGLEGFGGGEFVAPGAAQVEVCAHLVTMTWRNFLFSGSLSFLNRVVPGLQSVLAAIIAQDKDFDGFPDIQHETPGLDCAFASGLNVITAGLWIVALAAGERMARRQKLHEAAVYKQALDRASRSFERYFWNTEHGYYTLYPDVRTELVGESPLQTACHVGQLQPFWIADLLGLEGLFPLRHVVRALKTVETHHWKDGRLTMLSWPGGDGDESASPWSTVGGIHAYNALRYACCKLQQEFDGPIAEILGETDVTEGGVPPRHVSDLSLWYLIMALSDVRLDLADKRLIVRTNPRERGHKKHVTLFTPNGFGAVTIHINQSGALQCLIEFRMDIPQELTSIRVHLPAGAGEVQCRLELEDGPVPTNVNVFSEASGTRVDVFPEAKLSASAFSLQLIGSGAEEPETSSKRQWIPRWLRR